MATGYSSNVQLHHVNERPNLCPGRSIYAPDVARSHSLQSKRALSTVRPLPAVLLLPVQRHLSTKAALSPHIHYPLDSAGHVSACEGDCIAGITLAFLGNYMRLVHSVFNRVVGT